jgi:ubiquinone/menaquinone biosynthesis C-methylase UbiE
MDKYKAEFEYWNNQYNNKKFNNSWYEYFYTIPFELTKQDYANKKILDIGCGPMGSLEWISKESTCFGLDPLCNLYYSNFDCHNHNMSYIYAFCERIPFPSNYFDYVTAINSIDHVDDLQQSLLEISRVLKQSASYIMIVEINHKPTICEPQTLPDNFVEIVENVAQLKCIKSQIYGIRYKDNLFENIRENIQPENNSKILLAKFSKI